MTGRSVMLILLAAFFLTALLLIYNSFYDSGSWLSASINPMTEKM